MSPAAVDERLVEIFLEVTAVEGLSGQERDVADHVARFAAARGYSVQEQPVPDSGTGCLLIAHGGGGRIALSSHLDTARSTGGREPQRRADRIVSDGRGVLGVDNRVGVAVLLRTLERAAAGELRAEPFTVLFTVREETDLAGSHNAQLPEGVGMVFVFDSSLRPGHYIHRSHGARHFRAEMHGRSVHAGIVPEEGSDAIQALVAGLAALPWGRLGPEMTSNVGSIGGGGAINTVPKFASAEGEVRAVARDEVDGAVARIEDELGKAAAARGARLVFESRWDFEPFTLPGDAPICRRAHAALLAASLEPSPTISPGGSDANVFNARGTPAVNFGIGAQNPHSDDEFVLLEDLDAAARLAAALVEGS